MAQLGGFGACFLMRWWPRCCMGLWSSQGLTGAEGVAAKLIHNVLIGLTHLDLSSLLVDSQRPGSVPCCVGLSIVLLMT